MRNTQTMTKCSENYVYTPCPHKKAATDFFRCNFYKYRRIFIDSHVRRTLIKTSLNSSRTLRQQTVQSTNELWATRALLYCRSLATFFILSVCFLLCSNVKLRSDNFLQSNDRPIWMNEWMNECNIMMWILTGFADVEAVCGVNGFLVSVETKRSRRAVVMLLNFIAHCRLYGHWLVVTKQQSFTRATNTSYIHTADNINRTYLFSQQLFRAAFYLPAARKKALYFAAVLTFFCLLFTFF